MLSHLDAMGITVYTPKEIEHPSANPPSPLPAQPILCYELLHEDKLVGHVILDDIDVTPEKQVQIDELLDAMLRAVKLKRTLSSGPSPLTPLPKGEGNTQRALIIKIENETIKTHHPHDILENPALKRETWNTLKPIASRVWD